VPSGTSKATSKATSTRSRDRGGWNSHACLMGGVKQGAAHDLSSPRKPSTQAEPVATAPVEPPPKRKGSVETAPKPVGESSGAKVLVIEDDPSIRDMVVRVLSRENLVYEAPDGAKGWPSSNKVGASTSSSVTS